MATRDARGDLLEVLSAVESPGTFAASERLPMPMAALGVEGVGMLGMPVVQMEALCKASTIAPFGRGLETVTDESIRKAREIDGAKIHLADNFGAQIQEVAKRLATKLGVNEHVEVEARLYKLALYETGGFFKTHKDTERSEGNFASLVIQLPCEHQGGTLVVRQGTADEKRFEDASLDSFMAVAFWADMDHEVEPVTRGSRVCLLYNLVRTGKGPTPVPMDFQGIKAKLAAIEWDDDDEKAVLQLEHQYTTTNLPKFATLKGRDRAIVEALVNSELFDIYLALVTKHESGTATYDHYRRGRWHDDDDGEDASMEELCDTTISTGHWISVPDDKETELNLKIDTDMFEDDEAPTEREYEGYMGNSGPTLDYYYHKAVVVVWPRTNAVKVLCPVNVDVVVGILDRDLSTLQEALDYVLSNSTSAPRHAEKFLGAAVLHNNGAAARRALGLFSMEPGGPSRRNLSTTCGVSTIDRAKALADAMELFTNLEAPVLDLVRKFPSYTRPLATLALALNDKPGKEIARIIMAAVDKTVLLTSKKKDEAALVAEMLQTLELDDLLDLQSAPASVLAAIFLRSGRGLDLYVARLPTATDALDHCPRIIDLVIRNTTTTTTVKKLQDAVMGMPKNQALLKRILASDVVREHASKFTELAQARLKQIGVVKKPKKIKTTWRQPEANVPRHPLVTEFLRGPDETMVYANVFNDSRHAFNFARKHFDGSYNYLENHCARAVASGIKVTITKTKSSEQQSYDRALQQYEAALEERNRLLANFSLQTPTDNDDDVGEDSTGQQRPHKRQRSQPPPPESSSSL